MQFSIKTLYRWLILLIIAGSVFWIQYLLWIDEYGYGHQNRQKKALESIQLLEKEARLRQQQVQEEINAWQKDNNVIEEEARESLGMVKDGEELYVIED